MNKDLDELEEEIALLRGKKSGHRRTDPQTYSESVRGVETRFKCSVCTCELESKGLFDAHKKIHATEPSKCNICDKVFQENSDLNIHLKNAHEEQTVQDWNCNDCPFQGNDATELMNHLKATSHQPSPSSNNKKV